ncbi:MAG: hypothetical protein WBE03_14245, partial [Terracidiphilus sp.]
MANVLNPETESITLNTELETPTLEPATELEQPSYESTSNPEPSATVEVTPLDADALTQPAVATELPAVEAELPAVEEELSAAPATTPEETPAVAAVIHTPAAHAGEPVDDFSSALAAFEREQAAEAAAIEAYGDKIVSGKVVEQR